MKARKDFLALALAQIDCFIAPSHFVARRYSEAGFPKERITVIRNGIAVNRFSHPRMAPSTHSAHALRITFAGHFGAHKGVATLIEALALTSNTVLQLVGTGPEQKVYAERITTLGLENRVQFLGKVAPADMPGIYACSDLVILPSIWPENQPVCLMEAMAPGCRWLLRAWAAFPN
jgi:glycosyltransferase involved in cell wall biosynthesis